MCGDCTSPLSLSESNRAYGRDVTDVAGRTFLYVKLCCAYHSLNRDTSRDAMVEYRSSGFSKTSWYTSIRARGTDAESERLLGFSEALLLNHANFRPPAQRGWTTCHALTAFDSDRSYPLVIRNLSLFASPLGAFAISHQTFFSFRARPPQRNWKK